jgi:general secretion pathway protein G
MTKTHPQQADLNDPEAGLTLLELLIVLAIISIVGVVVAGQVVGQMDRAKVDLARLQLKQVDNALLLFQLDTGRYPTAEEGLGVLVSAPGNPDGWRGPYLRGDKALLDPWGHDLTLSASTEGAYVLTSLGSDGRTGGDGTAADVSLSSTGN